jgi:hypothetical protein
MSDPRSRSDRPTRGKRYPMLLQQQLNEQIFWPSIAIIALSAALLVWDPVELQSRRPLLAVLLTGTGLVLILTFVLRLMAYAQCRAEGLLVRLPFYRLTLPYADLKASRPTELFRMFPPNEQRWTQRRFLRSLLGRTVVVLELEQLPHRRPWLRLWMSKYMLCPGAVGIVLPVRDWIAFRTELDEFRARQPRS